MIILYYISRSGHACCYGPFDNTTKALAYGDKLDVEQNGNSGATDWKTTSLLNPRPEANNKVQP